MRQMFVAGLAILVAVSCTKPDMEGEVAAFAGAVSATSAAIRPNLVNAAQAEEDAAFAQAVAAREAVYFLTTECSGFVNRVPGVQLSDCVLEREGEAPDNVSTGKRALAQLDLLTNYLEALSALAKTNAPQDIATATGVVFGEIGQLGANDANSGLAEFAAEVKPFKDPVTNTFKFLAENYKFAAIRRVVLNADQPVTDIVDDMVLYFDLDPQSSGANAWEALQGANIEAELARTDGTLQQYAAAIDALERAHAEFIRVSAASPVNRLNLIAQTHAALAERMRTPSDPEDIVSFLEKLKALSDSFDAIP